jgi:hypothetical protein
MQFGTSCAHHSSYAVILGQFQGEAQPSGQEKRHTSSIPLRPHTGGRDASGPANPHLTVNSDRSRLFKSCSSLKINQDLFRVKQNFLKALWITINYIAFQTHDMPRHGKTVLYFAVNQANKNH